MTRPPPTADFGTVARLAFRHLVVRRGRALFLLFGYAIGAGVMMVLLSIGQAMLVQSRDVALVGGGELTVLPQGIDLEGLRTGTMSGLFYGIDQARFLDRQLIGGPRLAAVIETVSPGIEGQLLYLRRRGRLIALRAGGEIPSAARALRADRPLAAGHWEDEPADTRWKSPVPEELYHELDHFHSPAPDPTWAEWQYFNLAPGAGEWWYLIFLVGSDPARGSGAGQLVVTRHRPGLAPARFTASVSPGQVRIDTARADLVLGPNTVEQRNGQYRVRGQAAGPAGTVSVDLTFIPEPNAYFPPVEVESGGRRSGYVVPMVRGLARGTLCEAGRCRRLDGVPAYHDHNWGIWRAAMWNWGEGRGRALSLVYGGVVPTDPAEPVPAVPYFLAAVDSLGVRQILRFDRIESEGSRPVPGVVGVRAPARLRLTAVRQADTLSVAVDILRAQAAPAAVGGEARAFLQMRGRFALRGRLAGETVADSGLGFFETFVPIQR